jgi:hypothetical protein
MYVYLKKLWNLDFVENEKKKLLKLYGERLPKFK